MAKKKTTLEKVRELAGFSSRRVAEFLGLDISGFMRVERGEVTPMQSTARKIHEFWRGAVPLGMVYDPKHPDWSKWLNNAEKKDHVQRVARALAKLNPELEQRIKRRDA